MVLTRSASASRLDAADQVDEQRWTRSSPVISGWNDVASSVSLPDRDDPTHGRPGGDAWRAPRRPAPTFSTHGARMNTAWNGVVEAGDVEVGLEGVDLAAERVAAHGDVEAAEGLLAGGAALDAGRPA